MFNFFKKPPVFTPGVREDNRPSEEKIKDWDASEVVSFAPVQWREKQESEIRSFPIFNQDGSGSCFMQSLAKHLGINNYVDSNEKKFVKLSARDPYSRRIDKSNPGTIPIEGMQIACKYGATVEQNMPSDNLSDEAMRIDTDRTPTDEIIAKMYKGNNYFTLSPDIETIASFIETTKKSAIICIKASMAEWNNVFVTIKPGTTYSMMNVSHAISAIDYTIYNGKKCLVIEDSWGTNYGKNGRRYISEDFIKAGRIFFAGYVDDINNLSVLNNQTQAISYKFDNDMSIGSVGDDVKALQKCLATIQDDAGYLFPLTQEPTGYYGGITSQAVKRFQTKYGIQPVSGVVGPLTRSKLNELFNK